MNPDDERRDQILRFLYERHQSARGPSAIPIGIQELQRELKKRHAMTQQQVSSNLDYLVQAGWVREVVKERSFKTGKMEISREQTKYKISDIGINHLQAGTVFRKPQLASHVNITNIHGVTVLGDGNVVNTQFTDLFRALDELENAIGRSSSFSDAQKLDAAADIGTIRSQLAKTKPDTGIIGSAWLTLQAIATVEGVHEAIQKVEPFIRSMLQAAGLS